MLVAWIDPVLRNLAREAARVGDRDFSAWVEEAVRQHCLKADLERIDAALFAREKIFGGGQ